MSNLTTLPKGDSAWLLRKSIQRIMQQVSVLETNIGSSTTGNSADTQVIFNDNGTLRGDTGLTYDKNADRLSFGAGICYGLLTSASATITGDLTVATDRLRVVTGSTAVQIGATTQTQFGTTAWPTSYIAKSGSRVLIGSAGELILWNEAAAVIGNNSTLFVGAKSGPVATIIAGGAIKGGIENTSDYSGFLTLSTQRSDASMIERYRIDSTGVATWSNVGGVAGTAMTLNSTGLGVGIVPSGGAKLAIRDSGANDSYIGLGANNDIYLSTGTSGVHYFRKGSAAASMTIDATGNVGIGVTPSALNSSYKGIQIGGATFIFNNTGGASNSFFYTNAFQDAANNTVYRANGRSSGYLQLNAEHRWFYDSGTQVAGANCSFVQAMTLDASGNLLVGATTNTNGSRVFIRGIGTSPALALQSATGDVAMPGIVIGKFDNNSTTSQIIAQFTINNGAAGSGQINANGASQAAFGSYSDSRLKENIVNLPSQLASILSLRPVEFDYKDGSGHQIGFVAQEMQEVYSDAVGEQNGFLTVTGWSKTEARLVSAIKELAAKVQALEAKLA